MRQLTTALIAAQKQSARAPCVRVRAVNKSSGVIRQDWTRLYTGAEAEYLHGLTVPGDGSLIRVMVTPAADMCRLYRQRVANPGEASDYSQWNYTGQSDILAIAAASIGAEVSIFYIKANREIRRIKSTDYGVSWGSPELIDYSVTASVGGMAAAYKSNGDLAVFIADQSTLYVKKHTGGQWQSKAAWDKTTGVISGVACVYDRDWELLVTGRDTAGNYKLWSLVYGDGGDITAGNWSALKEIVTAPSGGEFSYVQPFIDKTDTHRCFYIEKFSGVEAYDRPFRSYTVPGTPYYEGLWREPSPFYLSSEYGLAMAHSGSFQWLSSPAGVWRSPSGEQVSDLSEDIKSVRQELGNAEGKLTVELSNDDGKYALPGQGSLAALRQGNQIEFSPGYLTYEGEEYSGGQYYTIDSIEHICSGGKASVIISARDGWGALSDWGADRQFRWNKNSDDFCVKDIMAAVLGRAGIKLAVISQSPVATGFYPEFTINPGNNGRHIIRKLLTFIPDVLFIEGDTAYLVNPQSHDSPVYSYGTDHVITEGKYRGKIMVVNRIQVEGWDPSAGRVIITDSFNWEETGCIEERPKHILDRNLKTVEETGQRGAAYLRQAEIESEESAITVPVNCGQQLYDVVSVTDAGAGLSAADKRITKMTLVYDPFRGEYYQKLGLGKV